MSTSPPKLTTDTEHKGMNREFLLIVFTAVVTAGVTMVFSSGKRALDETEERAIANQITSDNDFREILIEKFLKDDEFLQALNRSQTSTVPAQTLPSVDDVAESIKSDTQFIDQLKQDAPDLSSYALKSELHETLDLSLYALKSDLQGESYAPTNETQNSAPSDHSLKVYKNGDHIPMSIGDTVALSSENILFTVDSVGNSNTRRHVYFTWSNSESGKGNTTYVYQSEPIKIDENCSITPYKIDVEASEVKFKSNC